MKSRKARPIQPCTASTRACSALGRLRPKTATSAPKKAEDQHPEQHRAFVVAPDAGDLEEQRLRRMAVLPDVAHREVRGDIARRSAPRRRPRCSRSRHRGASAPRRTAARRASAAREAAPSIGRASARAPAPARNGRARRRTGRRSSVSRPPRLPATRPCAFSASATSSACSSRRAWRARCRRRDRRPRSSIPRRPRPAPRGKGPAGCRDRRPARSSPYR